MSIDAAVIIVIIAVKISINDIIVFLIRSNSIAYSADLFHESIITIIVINEIDEKIKRPEKKREDKEWKGMILETKFVKSKRLCFCLNM